VIEGMAEYLSVGPYDPQTAMWLRDAAIEDRLPDLDDLNDPRFFPYRFGHAFWAYIAGRWGDGAIGQILQSMAGAGDSRGLGPLDAIELATGKDRETLATEWHQAILQAYDITPGSRPESLAGRTLVIGERSGSGRLNVGPSLSPDGTRIAFLSERNRLSIDLFLADTATGEIVQQLTKTAADPHFESLQFLASAGSWNPDGTQLVVATVRTGRPALAFFRASDGDLVDEIRFPELGEIFQPAWSPDGATVAFTAQVGGFTDLYVYDLQGRATKRLTEDAFADLQPAWSPDGRRIAFTTDRFSTTLDTLAIGDLDLATLTVATGAIERVETGLDGDAINPQWSPDGRALVFVSNASGRPNAYRLVPGEQPSRLTSTPTGVAGITPTSPALSIAAKTGEAAVTVFRDSGYEIQLLDPDQAAEALAGIGAGPDLGSLPPTPRPESRVTQLLEAPATGLPATDAADEEEYSSKLGLVGIGQQIGVATGGVFGTNLAGGIAMQFSDVLGNHVVGTSVSLNGDFQDIGASISYLNRTNRWNWGVFAERAPFLSGGAATGFDTVDGQTVFVEQVQLFRQTYSQTGAVLAYPFSRSFRVEFNGGYQHIGFSREVRTRFFDPVTGAFLGETTEDLPTSDSIGLVSVGSALVRDTAAFGAVGPILGQRLRLDVSPSYGDLTMTTLSADVRQYVMPVRPVTLAGRVLHLGRYGNSAEDARLLPLFLGYPTLVRGYSAGSFEPGECTATPDGSCPEFDRLRGSRLLVVNGEVRAPAVGLFTGNLDYGPVPVELFGFWDAGVAWSQDEQPEFAGGARPWVMSVGGGARVNLFGFAIGEFNMVRPIDRPGRGWMFVFNLRPGY
jgi:hypothetical protein